MSIRHRTEREQVVAACQEMERTHMVVGTAGNVSARIGEEVVISPSGVPYADLTPEMIGVHDMGGTRLDGDCAPSSELPLHLAIYSRSDAGAVVHNHSDASTALGLVADEVATSHYYSALFGGQIRVAPYATFGTDGLAEEVARALEGRKAVLMANHGALTVGADIPAALSLLPYLEYLCRVQLLAMSTGAPVRTLAAEEIANVERLLRNYGQTPREQ